MPYGDKIAYRQFEDDIEKPIDIREVVSYMLCFDIENFSGDDHPISAYTSKKKCLDLYRKEAEKEEKGQGISSFRKLRPLLKKILALRDHIYIRMPEIYREAGGRFGRLRGVISDKETPLYFLPVNNGNFPVSRYAIPSAYLYPILASFRALVKVTPDGTFGWKTDPIKFFDEEIGATLVDLTIAFGTDMRNPNTVGKAKYFWGQLYEKCQKKLEEVMNATAEAEVASAEVFAEK
jgi:hypothetical protein